MRMLHHLCIQTNCYEETIAFYRDILEFELVKETPGFHGRDYNTWMQYGGIMLEIQTPKEKELSRSPLLPQTGLQHFCFKVENVTAEYERMVTLGYNHFKLKNGKAIYTVEGGKLLKVLAPEGTIIEMRDSELE